MVSHIHLLQKEGCMIKYIYELIGTFFLVFTVGMTVLSPFSAGVMAPLAIGAILAVMVYAGGHISGGHYNPAVSFAVWLRKRLSTKDMIGYWIFQVVGAFLGASVSLYFKGCQTIQTMITVDPTKTFIAEFLFTFALCYVVLNVATSRSTTGNSFFGFAIGCTVLVGAYCVGSISGGAFNPAVVFGIMLMKLIDISQIWVYLVANLLAGASAALIFRKAHPTEI